MNQTPEIIFSKWREWSKRNTLDHIDEPGVYILAHLPQLTRGRANPGRKEIIYIGETCDSSLRERWRQFNRSAFQNKFGHSGGATYRERFLNDAHILFVAAMPAGNIDGNLRSLFIRYVERKLILDYALKWGNPPLCNRK